MKLQFSITICLIFFTAGWYVVTKGNILSAVLCFCGLRADCLESNYSREAIISNISHRRSCLKYVVLLYH